MKKFEYNLEKILEIKRKLEDQVRAEFQSVKMAYDIEVDKLKMLNISQDKYKNKMRKNMEGKLEFIEIKKTKNSIETMNILIEDQNHKILQAQRKLNIVSAKLNQAMLERKTHEKLKDKALEEYMEEYKAWEHKEIDELNSFKYGSRKSEGGDI